MFLKHDLQTDGSSQLYIGCSLVQGIFTKNFSCLSLITAEKIMFSKSLTSTDKQDTVEL